MTIPLDAIDPAAHSDRWRRSFEQSERWRSVVGHEGSYEVSNLGRVRSLARRDSQGHTLEGRLLKLRPHPSGHLQVTLTRNGVCDTAKVHRLVLEAFVGPCPEGMMCCHRNGIPSDNRVANLRWDTGKANSDDRATHGTQQGSKQRVCSRRHRIEGPNLKLVGTRRRCRACMNERSRASATGGQFDVERANRNYREFMGEIA